LIKLNLSTARDTLMESNNEEPSRCLSKRWSYQQ
jgi:hypothetical protein